MRSPLTLLLVVATLLGALVASAAPASAAAPSACADGGLVPTAAVAGRAVRAVTCLVNAERAAAGLPAVRPQAQLRGAASAFAARMVAQRFFAHVTPDGQQLLGRIQPTGYVAGSRAFALGETIAWGTGAAATPRGVVASWMASPPHRAALLDARYRDVGIGIALGAPRAGVTAGAATYVGELGVR